MVPPAVLRQAEQLAGQYPHKLVALLSADEELYVYVSPSHQAILGRHPQSLLGGSWREVVAPEDQPHASLAGNDALLHGQSIEFGLQALTGQGDRVQLRGRARIVIDTGTRARFLLFQAAAADS